MKIQELADKLAERFEEIGTPDTEFMPQEAIGEICERLYQGECLCVLVSKQDNVTHMEFRFLKEKKL